MQDDSGQENRAAAQAPAPRTKVEGGHAHGAGSLTEEVGLPRARRPGNGIVYAGAYFRKPQIRKFGVGKGTPGKGRGRDPGFGGL